ncbi:MAG: cation:proton antiporter [Spirochaetes bacterium]|nr:cation:proton antiporter [Spirochaetota bacterium]
MFFSDKVKFPLILIIMFFIPALLIGAVHGPVENSITHQMTMLVIQIGVIIYSSRLGGHLFKKIKMPQVLGELVAGIIIGPYMLGSISLPLFPDGIFPLMTFSTLPISAELYGFATVASIILLFSAGLETDFDMFLKFSFTGTILGVGGVVASFVIGTLTAVFFMHVEFMSPEGLFMGVMSTATSVGITARILSDKRKMDSPEGVSIMAGAVIDDILGIIILAVVLGISVAEESAGAVIDWKHIGLIALKALGVWFFFTLLGLVFAHRISRFLKIFKTVSSFSVMALGLAFMLSGIFEKAGLALIIGAYVMGLSLSRTDLSFVIHDKLHTIQLMFIPLFFAVMGMLVNPMELASREILIFGAVYTIGAIIAKIIGCGLPAMFLNFNTTGAMRIGLGMVPRGEVALIIAGIGLSYGILNDTAFGVAIFMTLASTIVSPPLLSMILNDKSGTKKEIKTAEKFITSYDFPSQSITSLIESEIVESFYREGFFINVIEYDMKTYHIKKEVVDILFTVGKFSVEFKSDKEDIPFIKNIMYETLLKFNSVISGLNSILESIDMRKEISVKGRTNKNEIRKYLKPSNIIMELQGNSKKDVIIELVAKLEKNGEIDDKDAIVSAVMEREEAMSTGLSDGLAIPHAKSGIFNGVKLALGFKKEGIDFGALDNKPCRIIFLIVSPENSTSSHLQMVSNITSIFCDEHNRNEIFKCVNSNGVYEFLAE